MYKNDIYISLDSKALITYITTFLEILQYDALKWILNIISSFKNDYKSKCHKRKSRKLLKEIYI